MGLVEGLRREALGHFLPAVDLFMPPASGMTVLESTADMPSQTSLQNWSSEGLTDDLSTFKKLFNLKLLLQLLHLN